MLQGNYLYREYSPSPELREYVKCYWTFSGPQPPKDLHQRILPNGCCELILHFGNLYKNISGSTTFIEPQIAFFGPISSVNRIIPLGQVRLAAIRFTPTGFFRLFKVPTHLLTDKILDSEEFRKVNKKLSIDQPIEYGFSNIVSSFEKFLSTYLRHANTNNSPKRIEFVVNHIQLNKGVLTMATLPELVNLSERHFEQLFKDHVGLSAKRYANIVRFNSILNCLLSKWDESLTKLGHLYHYYDQSHFIKDFKRMTGLSPTDFLSYHKGDFFFDK